MDVNEKNNPEHHHQPLKPIKPIQPLKLVRPTKLIKPIKLLETFLSQITRKTWEDIHSHMK